ncbi:hypothetical protein CRM22_007567 [Opisthorchis felineus]|uniref:RBR-type E3 ubiquitin transferase n=1 Tax=Opisthorchis felineus TaxID=147828 RepID=A0A4S2LFC7_OPIFE|nr:hypothetical protein CRM22_007567 [Opisthorchis felineus]
MHNLNSWQILEIEFLHQACPKLDPNLCFEFSESCRTGSFWINISLPESGIWLCGPATKEPPRNDVLVEESPERCVYRITHIPPIIMNFSLPPAYPGRATAPIAPSLSLDSCWMPQSMLFHLTKCLKHLISSNPGELILWSLVEFLRNESLPVIFDCTNTTKRGPLHINLFDYFARHHKELPFSIAQCTAFFVAHNDDCLDLEYDSARWECPVCFTTKLGTKFFRFRTCKHRTCMKCVRQGFICALKDGLMEQKMACLLCGLEAEPNEARRVLPSTEYDRYESLLLNRALNRMPDIAFCPRPGCNNNPVILDYKDLGRCTICEMAFCPRCNCVSHGMQKCPKRSSESDDEEKRIDAEESATQKYLKENSKRCPGCGAHVLKNEGCNKMTCSNCSSFFCWLCGKSILDRRNPYSHFGPGTPCAGQLFRVT